MADVQQAIAEGLALLGKHVVFREESDELKLAALIEEIAPGGFVAEPELADMTKAQLLARAEAAGLAVTPNDTKAELVAALEDAGGSSS